MFPMYKNLCLQYLHVCRYNENRKTKKYKKYKKQRFSKNISKNIKDGLKKKQIQILINIKVIDDFVTTVYSIPRSTNCFVYFFIFYDYIAVPTFFFF